MAGAVVRIADLATAIPGGAGTFIGFTSPPCVHSGHVAFQGVGSAAQAGIYSDAPGPLAVVADKSDPIPDGSGNFVSFAVPDCLASNVAFVGTGGFGFRAIFSTVSGSLAQVENNSGAFSSFGRLSMAGAQVATTANGDTAGEVYVLRGDSSPLATLADHTTDIPGGIGTFTSFEDATFFTTGHVAFVGSGSGGQRGVYTTTVGGVAVIANLSGGVFTALDSPTASSDWLAFLGDVAGNEGIYVHHAGTTEKLIAEGDPLDGSTVLSLELGPFGLDVKRSVRVAFRANLANGSSAIWMASQALPVPALSTLQRVALLAALFAATAVALRSARRRGRSVR